jgi:hypothetical protein
MFRQIRDMAPSKGAKRFRARRGHQPTNNCKPKLRALDTVRLFNVLREREWTFEFKVEALSPRGFKYEARGATPEEAFLRAFGQWQKDFANHFADLIPKIPGLLAGMKKAEFKPKPAGSSNDERARAIAQRSLRLEQATAGPGGILRARWEKSPVTA